MYRGLYGKPFITMDHLVYIERLKSLHDDIIMGISMSYRQYGIYGINVVDKDKYLDIRVAEKMVESLPLDDPVRVKYDLLPGRADRRTFLKLTYGAYSGFQSVTLKSSVSFDDKHDPEKTPWLKNSKFFPSLISWIEDLPIFSAIGRINLFCTEHDCLTVEHRDITSKLAHQNEMIWFRTRLDKSLYILDQGTQERHYFPGYCTFFNDHDVHGGDAPSRMVFSMRVDGQFTVETRRAIGVPDDPKY